MLAHADESTAPVPEEAAVLIEKQTKAARSEGASDWEESRSFLMILLRALGAMHT